MGWLLVCAGLVILGLKLGKVYDPAPAVERLSAKAGPKAANFVKSMQPDRVVYALLVCLPVGLGVVLLFSSSRVRSDKAETPKAEEVHATAAWNSSRTNAKKTAIHSCTVLQAGMEPRQLWQFDARNGGFVLNRQQTTPPGEALPSALVAKDWRTLFQRKLNVAWLPAEHVFLRVAQLPLSDFKETLSMVELQLEKLSPVPVAQIVWSVDVLPHPSGNMQTVIVLMVARNVVEEFLGKLEGQGYLADALELPLLDQLHATPVTENGAWIYPEAMGGKNTGLAAWWYGGVLQNLDLLTFSTGDNVGGLKEQLNQMTWAGELEGWLTSPPRFHLVANGPLAAEWQPVLQASVDHPVQVVEGLAPAQLAAATAQRAAQTADSTNLLPTEFSTRYQQQFYDRLWMRGLFAVAGLYLFGVLVYGVLLGFKNFQTGRVEAQVAQYSNEYTNTIQLRERVKVLQDRQDLKYAGLDCWRAVAELLPVNVTLDGFNFSEGRRLSLNGTAPSDQVQAIFDFDAAMRKHKVGEPAQPLFDAFGGENPTYTGGQGGNISWRLGLDLKRTEVK
jgi:hypothetical protein